MSVKFNVKMTEKYMFDFMLYHNYTHLSGLISAIFGVLSLWLAIYYVSERDMQYFAIWLMCAVLMLVVNPYTMKTRAKAQVENTEMFKEPLKYELTESGIVVRQGDVEVITEWSDVTKAVSTQKSIILYLGRIRALIFPKECMGEQYEEVLKMVHTHVPARYVKIRHIH